MLNFPEFAQKCIENIEKSGHEAYFVGGCVRDGLFGMTFDDVDITTSATPDEICEIFDKTIPTGIKHGTVTVIIDGKHLEVTTFRTETGYNDSRHPDSVEFVKDIKFDLSRRDFTVNAMAFNPKSGLIDLFGGKTDLEKQIIRTVGDPNKRFEEDALRIIRAFRFASKLGFKIEEETLNSALKMGDLVQNISGERIYSELIKIANSKFPENSERLFNSGTLLPFGLGRFKSESANYKVLIESTLSTQEITALFVSLFEHNIELIKANLHPDNLFLKLLKQLDDLIERKPNGDNLSIKQCLRTHGDAVKLYGKWLQLTKKDSSGKFSAILEEIKTNNEPYLISHLTVNGNDLLSLGFSGEEIRTLLNIMLDEVVKHPEHNQKNFLIDFLGK